MWIAEDGWTWTWFGGRRAADRSRGRTIRAGYQSDDSEIRITEITDQAQFNNDGLANRPFCKWADDFEEELALEGPRFQQYFGKNRMV